MLIKYFNLLPYTPGKSIGFVGFFPPKSEDFFDGSDIGLKWVGNFDPLKAIKGRRISILNNINQLTSDF